MSVIPLLIFLAHYPVVSVGISTMVSFYALALISYLMSTLITPIVHSIRPSTVFFILNYSANA